MQTICGMLLAGITNHLGDGNDLKILMNYNFKIFLSGSEPIGVFLLRRSTSPGTQHLSRSSSPCATDFSVFSISMRFFGVAASRKAAEFLNGKKYRKYSRQNGETNDPNLSISSPADGHADGRDQAIQIRDTVLNKIFVRHAWSITDGGLKCPKNGEEREIPLLPIVREAIEDYLDNKPFVSNPDALLFPSEVPGVPYDEKQVVEDFYRVLSSIVISEKERKARNIVLHSWRHYCAKNLAAVTTKSIGMKILGHKTSVMFDHYSDHVDKETFKAMEEAMSNGLGSRTVAPEVIEFMNNKKIG